MISMEMNCVNKIINSRYEVKKCFLNELVFFERGKNITSSEMLDGDIPVVSAGISYSGYHNQANVFGPAITISASGANAGVVLFHNYDFWAADCSYSAKSSNILFAKHFLKYLQPIITNLQMGAAQPHVYAKNVNNLKVELPSRDVQDKIARVLENYDQLIENNNKRIKLLEDMAESLYKEWFVRFRFPGHENIETKLQSAKGWTFGDREDGQLIPKDWNFKELSEIAEFKRGRNITSSQMTEGNIPVIAAGLEPSGFHNEANVNGYSLTISASGANAGYMSYHLEDIWAADCSYYQNNENLWFVYNALNFLQPVISNMQIGSAQPHVYAKNINRLSTIIPDKDFIKSFVGKVKHIYEEIKILNEKKELLIKQRDSLLPRLMSGKLSVEGKEVI